MKFLSGLLHFIQGIILFYLLFVFIRWYVMGHFNKKWWWAFWAFTVFSIINAHVHTVPPGFENDPRTGQEIWNENMKNYDAQRGY